jgi:hypothetical protein
VVGCINHAEAEIRGAYGRVGGIAGFVNEATLNECINYDDIAVVNEVVGGIAGENRGNIANSENHGKISGLNRVGGIAGDNYAGVNVARIRFCLNMGEVNGDSFIGGIAGLNYAVCTASINRGRIAGTGECIGGIVGGLAGPVGYVLACYNEGSVAGGSKVGGLVGSSNLDGLIKASYSTGAVSGTKDTGGVCGFFEDEASSAEDCYWTGFNGKGVSYGYGSALYFDDGTTPPAGVTTGWPETTLADWGVGDGSDSKWWKNLGTPGTKDYPELFWE